MRVVYADAQSMAYQEEEPRMAISTRTTYDVDIEDVEYLRHGDKPLLARLFKPRGRTVPDHGRTAWRGLGPGKSSTATRPTKRWRRMV